jgi:hypothetical protein
MATIEECRSAIETVLGRLSAVDPEVRKGKLPNRTIGVHLLDLDKTFVGDLKDGEIVNVHIANGGVKPQIRLVCSSDDLLAMSDGDLSFARAWATGQVRLDASIRDLLRLRNLGG